MKSREIRTYMLYLYNYQLFLQHYMKFYIFFIIVFVKI